MPIIYQEILNAICEYHLTGGVLSDIELTNLINFSEELITFLQILS